jgi:hypothetical protein
MHLFLISVLTSVVPDGSYDPLGQPDHYFYNHDVVGSDRLILLSLALLVFAAMVGVCGVLLWSLQKLWARSAYIFGADGLRPVTFLLATIPFLEKLVKLASTAPACLARVLLEPWSVAVSSGSQSEFWNRLPNELSMRGWSSNAVCDVRSDILPFEVLLQVLLLWAGTGQVLSLLFSPINKQPETLQPLATTLQTITSRIKTSASKLQTSAAAMILVVSMGLFLTLAAIIVLAQLKSNATLPQGQDTSSVNEELSTDKLSESFKPLSKKLQDKHPYPLGDALGLSALDTALTKELADLKSEPSTKVNPEVLTKSALLRQNTETARKELERARKELESAQKELETAREAKKTPRSADDKKADAEAKRKAVQRAEEQEYAYRGNLRKLKGDLERLRQQRDALQASWTAVLEQADVQLDTAKSQAELTFDLNLKSQPKSARFGMREHFLDVGNWYMQRHNVLSKHIASMHGRVLNFDWECADWVAEVRKFITDQDSSVLPLAPFEHAHYLGLEHRREFSEQMKLPDLNGNAAQWASLNLLMLLAGWLLRFESLQLTIVVGMLGAGLLGATVGSVLNNGNTQTAFGPLILRGFTAAIVLFLGIEGGLSVISATAAEQPNAYVLIGSCLVAAAYSEQAWVRIRNKFFQNEKQVDTGKKPEQQLGTQQQQQPAGSADAEATPAENPQTPAPSAASGTPSSPPAESKQTVSATQTLANHIGKGMPPPETSTQQESPQPGGQAQEGNPSRSETTR